MVWLNYSFCQKKSVGVISEQQISAKEISLFPTRVLCFWDRVQQFSWTCGCSLAFTLGIPIFDFHTSVHRLILARQTHILEQGEKAGSKHVFRVYDNLICNFFSSYSQIFNILAINSNSSTLKTDRECLLLTQCMGGGFLYNSFLQWFTLQKEQQLLFSHLIKWKSFLCTLMSLIL